MPETQRTQLLRYVRQHGIIRPRDLAAIHIPRAVLKRLVDEGDLMRRSQGVYTMSDHEPTRHTDLAEVCARSPKSTVCLISALEFHELTTQIPHAVWIMIDRSGRRPKIDHPPVSEAKVTVSMSPPPFRDELSVSVEPVVVRKRSSSMYTWSSVLYYFKISASKESRIGQLFHISSTIVSDKVTFPAKAGSIEFSGKSLDVKIATSTADNRGPQFQRLLRWPFLLITGLIWLTLLVYFMQKDGMFQD